MADVSATIAVSGNGQMWEDALVAEAQAAGLEVVTCAGLVDLLVAAQTARARIVVVSEDLPRLGEGLEQLRAAARVVVVGTGPLADRTPAAVLLDELLAGAGAPAEPAAEVVTVWGPQGSWGATTVAIGLAGELAAVGRTLLLDANVHAASVAVDLGLEPGGLVQACLSADRGALQVPVQSAGALDVVTGAQPHLYPAVHAGALRQVLADVRRDRDRVVIDVDSAIDAAGDIGLVPDWTTATAVALAAADHVVVVTGEGPRAEQRLFAALPTLVECTTGPMTVVVNRCTDPQWVRTDFAVRLADYLPDAALGWIAGPVTGKSLAPIVAELNG